MLVLTPLWLRSIQRRPHTVVLLFVLASMVVMTSVLGPLLVRAVHQSALSDALAGGGLAGRSISVSGEVPADEAWQPVRDASGGVLASGREGAPPLWDEPTTLITSTTIVSWQPARQSQDVNALVNAVDGCTGYVIATGSCPAGPGEAMISTDDASERKIKPGDRLTFNLARTPETSVRLVGVYDPVASAAAGIVRPGSTEGVLAGAKSDPLVLTSVQAEQLPLPVTLTTRMSIPGLSIDQVAPLLASIERIKAAANEQGRLLALQTTLPETLEGVDRQAGLAQVLVLITDVQALLLAVFALAVVLQRVGRSRAAEWSVGRLRGVRRHSWLGSVYIEATIALLLGLPVGALAGIAVARIGVDLTLRPGTPLEPGRWPVIAAAVGATIIALIALVAVSLRSVRRPLAELVGQEVENRQLGRLGAVVQSGVFLLAVITVYQLVIGGPLTTGGPQLGLLAPGLFALGVALLAVRAAVLLVRRRTTQAPGGLAALVIGRHAARMPSALNPAMIIAVGVALAIFATQVHAFSVRNQSLRADAAVGAHTVLTVSVPSDVDLRTAVRTADPDGEQAMAVRETPIEGFNGISRVVAVDSPRLAAVSTWSPAWSDVADVSAALRGQEQPPVIIKGDEVQVDLTDVRVRTSTTGSTQKPPPEVVLTITAGGRWQTVKLGRLDGKAPKRQQTLTSPVRCPDGCRVVALGLQSASDSSYEAWFTVAGISTDQQQAEVVDDSLRTAGRWRPQSVNNAPQALASAVPLASPEGLAIEAKDTQGGLFTAVSPADAADPLPAILGPSVSAEQVAGGDGTGLDGQPQQLTAVGRATILPRTLDEGVLVDLGHAGGLSDPAQSRTIDQVWLAADADAGLEQRLTEQGLRVQGKEQQSTVRADLEGQASTRGAAAAMIIGGAALLLTLLALIAARWTDADRRRMDWLVLREGGVSPRRLRGLVRTEIAVPNLLGVVVGALSGAAAARIAGSRLPVVDMAAPGPPLDLQLSWLPIMIISVGTAVLIMVIAQVGAMMETRTGEDR